MLGNTQWSLNIRKTKLKLQPNMVNKKTMKHIDFKLSRFFKSFKFWSVLISILAGILLSLFLFIQVSKWYDEHRVVFQSPIIVKLQSPVLIQDRSPETTIKVKAIKLEGGVDESGNVEAGLSKGQIAYEAY